MMTALQCCSLLGLACALMVGCDSEPVTHEMGDASVPDAASVDGTVLPSGAVLAEPTLPQIPRQATMEPCAPGWRLLESISEGGGPICEPWPEGGAQTCDMGSAHFVGDPDCTPVGARCPTGEWPEDLPDDRPILYVKLGASNGDGSRTSPFGTIANATSVATAGTVIALSRDSFEEAVVLREGVALIGACTAETSLNQVVSGETTVTVLGPAVEIRNLRVSGSGKGIKVEPIGEAVVDGVLVEQARVYSVLVEGAARLHNVVIRNTMGGAGHGFVVMNGGTAQVDRTIVEGSRKMAVIAHGSDSQLQVSNSLIRNTREDSTQGLGIGFLVQDGARGELRQVAIEDSVIAGVAVGEGSAAEIMDTVIRRTAPPADGMNEGNGILVEGAVTLERTLIEQNGNGINACSARADVLLSDVIVRDSRNYVRLGVGGVGLKAALGASINGRRLSVEGSANAGIGFIGATTTSSLSDVVVLDTEDPNGADSAGVLVNDGAELEVKRLLVSRSRGRGISGWGTGSRLHLADTSVFDTKPGEDGNAAGVVIQNGPVVEAARLLLKRNAASSLHISTGQASITATDVIIRDTQPGNPGIAGCGVGVIVFGSTNVDIQRILVENTPGVGVHIVGPNAAVDFEDLQVLDTNSWTSAPAADGFAAGRGIEIQRGSRVTVRRALVERSRATSIYVWSLHGTRLELHDAIVKDTRSIEVGGLRGRGLAVANAGELVASDVRFQRNREVSVFASGPQVTLRMNDIEILDSLAAECSASTCINQSGGIGIGAYDGASVEMVGFVVSRSDLCGVQVGSVGEMDLHHGTVSFGLIGANVQNPDYDLDRLTDNVFFIDNGLNLDADILPVPKPSDPLDLETD